ncbi:MAG TPA: HD domain-containing phosphohydrolase [Gemmatimonadales bacterium]
MSEPVLFVQAVGQALAAAALYATGHPARDRAVAAGWASLEQLLQADRGLVLSFLGGEVVFGGRVLHELKSWEWAERLAGAGMERIEFGATTSPADFADFVAEAHRRLQGDREARDSAAGEGGVGGIRWGRVALARESLEALAEQVAIAPVSYSLHEELAGIGWMHEQAAGTDTVAVPEAELIVRSLALAMRQEGKMILPLLELRRYDQYTVTHSCNVAVMAMGLAEHLGLPPREVRAVGVAGLLHDIGKVKVPQAVVNKRGPYTALEMRRMQQHPIEGAKLILGRHRHMDLAAVVAYEHHLRFDGGGYPKLLFPREPHFVTRIVSVSEVYDALCSGWAHRKAHTPEEALMAIEAESGGAFDPAVVAVFGKMMRQVRTPRLSVDDPVVTVDEEVVPPS